jgi:hypothetical protein
MSEKERRTWLNKPEIPVKKRMGKKKKRILP